MEPFADDERLICKEVSQMNTTSLLIKLYALILVLLLLVANLPHPQ